MRLRLRRGGCLVLGSLLVLATSQRVQVWSGPELGLWAEAVRVSPQKPRAWINLGAMHESDGQLGMAFLDYQTAERLALRRMRYEGAMRGLDVARFNLALLLAKQGRYREASMLTDLIRPRVIPSIVTQMEGQWQVLLRESPS